MSLTFEEAVQKLESKAGQVVPVRITLTARTERCCTATGGCSTRLLSLDTFGLASTISWLIWRTRTRSRAGD
jgi:hypothetical protein